MPAGGYYVRVTGLDELKTALRGARGGMRDLRRVYGVMAETMGHDVQRRVPIGSTSSKDGGAHKSLPRLASTVQWGATVRGPWTSVDREDVYLHEFGGTSFWYRGQGGAGSLRGANRRHATVIEAASRSGISGHSVYTKPKTPLGNFIWNVGFRKRSELGEQLYFGIQAICAMHDLDVELDGNLGLDITPSMWAGQDAA